jgi:hypothetical protein
MSRKDLSMSSEATNKPPKTIDYFVNGDAQSTNEHKLAVKTILENAGFKPAADYELSRDEGDHAFSDLNELVPIHKDERFTATHKAPTPVS